jgi:hypothetical protein
MSEMSMDEAIQAAIKLKDEISQTDASAAYPELEKAIRTLESDGYPIESIIPQGADAQLGFMLRSADGKTFFQVYSTLIRKNLCAPNGEFNKLMKSGINSSVGAVLTAIVTALGIPLIALGVVIPIAVLIANTGLDAFCEINKEGT